MKLSIGNIVRHNRMIGKWLSKRKTGLTGIIVEELTGGGSGRYSSYLVLWNDKELTWCARPNLEKVE